MNRIIGVEWRVGGTGTVGIVLVLCRDGMKRAYIGVGKSHNEQADADWIKAYGVRLKFKEASAFFGWLKAEEYSEEGL